MSAEPIRKHLADFPDAQYIQAECTAINFSEQSVKAVQCAAPTTSRLHQSSEKSSASSASSASVPVSVSVPYDQLVIAVGAEPATFNIPGVREHCMFIKEIDDGMTDRETDDD